MSRAISLDGVPAFELPEPKKKRKPKLLNRFLETHYAQQALASAFIPTGNGPYSYSLPPDEQIEWTPCRTCDKLMPKNSVERRQGRCWACHTAMTGVIVSGA
jgi:hypothetical protein